MVYCVVLHLIYVHYNYLTALYLTLGLYTLPWSLLILTAHTDLLEMLLSSCNGHVPCLLIHLFVLVWMETCGVFPAH